MAAAAALTPGKDLLVIAPFEPVPLFDVLAKQGFTHAAREIGGGDWEVLFQRDAAQAPAGEGNSNCACGCPAAKPAAVIELDARGLEPPQPLVRILEALSSLPEGAELRARTQQRPIHLYARLEERGFKGQTEESANGSYITHIRRG
jgi:uncharacterized protein (DUF2249 family)